ncbi:hypothetical protein FAI41_01650 [Acetobacteraceae bacterium]|nr:hypothetical protein FAI41_01650 [Acetobacteraceae bacterium]
MKKKFKNLFMFLALLVFFYDLPTFALSSSKSLKAQQNETSESEASPQEVLEFLSLGEYWGVRTDIDAAQGGNAERKIIDLQYDWDNVRSASKEEEAFSKAEKESKTSQNLQKD